VSAARHKLTPPQIAERYGISSEKVIVWIKAGELRAFNAAMSATGRPRWLIDEADLTAFEQRRSAQPSKPAARRRKAAAGVIEFF
jgi:helix-turn-helix protein